MQIPDHYVRHYVGSRQSGRFYPRKQTQKPCFYPLLCCFLLKNITAINRACVSRCLLRIITCKERVGFYLIIEGFFSVSVCQISITLPSQFAFARY